ncbi:MAG TPA: YdeI/OmpD-associated family protein [Solirubrobacteraceae bacterium]
MSAPIFFPTPGDWRKWLAEHHLSKREVLVGLYKKASGRGGMSWSEAVDQALCFGWIDGVRRGVDEHSHSIRFTPRKPRSTWSAVNIAKAERLIAEGRMQAAGLRAFQARSEENSRIYAFEQGEVELPPAALARLQANAAAWSYWSARPPGYRRIAAWWVISAKRSETRERRLATLIEDCAAGRLIKSQRRNDG